MTEPDRRAAGRQAVVSLVGMLMVGAAAYYFLNRSSEPPAHAVPTITIDGRAASAVSFGPWNAPSASFLESNMSYKGYPGGIDARWTAYDAQGVKLWDGDVQIPSLKPGETGRAQIMNPQMDKTVRITITVDGG